MTFLACFGIFVAFVILLVSVLVDDQCRWKQSDKEFKDFEKDLHIVHLDKVNRQKGGLK